MSKPILAVAILLAILFSGCSNPLTSKNSLSDLQSQTQEQQAKLDELQQYKDEQLRLQEEQAKQEEEKKKEEEQARIEADQRKQKQDKLDAIESCEAKKKQCQNDIASFEQNVARTKKDYERSKDELADRKKEAEENDWGHEAYSSQEANLKSYKKILDNAEEQLQEKINECEAYEKPCE